MTAYHESTHQPRATINLAKAVKLIDDRSSLIQPDVAPAATGKKRRKSAFAEEEEGYMFVEEGFRIRFGNGETIDFYADDAQTKQGWMTVLSEVVGRPDPSSGGAAKGWTELVLRREAKMQLQQKKQQQPQSATANGQQVKTPLDERPSSAPKTEKTKVEEDEEAEMNEGVAPLEKNPRAAGQQRKAMSPMQRRQKTKSMIF